MKKKRRQWSRTHRRCVDCGTSGTEYFARHHGLGRCFRCYFRAKMAERRKVG